MRETPKAAAAFEEYCAMGTSRSLRKLAAKQIGSKSIATEATLMNWSRAFAWQERVKFYDAERIEARRVKQEAELDRMNDEHALLGRTQALRAIKQIEELIKAQHFGSQAAVQLFKISTDLERIARGASTDRIAMIDNSAEQAQPRGVDFSIFTQEELAIIQPIFARAEERRRIEQGETGIPQLRRDA